MMLSCITIVHDVIHMNAREEEEEDTGEKLEKRDLRGLEGESEGCWDVNAI